MSFFGLPPASFRLIVATSILASVIGLGLWAISAWRTQLDERVPDDEELLEQFREVYESGDMDEDEFRRVCGVLLAVEDDAPEPQGSKALQVSETEKPGPGADKLPP